MPTKAKRQVPAEQLGLRRPLRRAPLLLDRPRPLVPDDAAHVRPGAPRRQPKPAARIARTSGRDAHPLPDAANDEDL